MQRSSKAAFVLALMVSASVAAQDPLNTEELRRDIQELRRRADELEAKLDGKEPPPEPEEAYPNAAPGGSFRSTELFEQDVIAAFNTRVWLARYSARLSR